MIFRTYGVNRIQAAVERGIALAERSQELVSADPHWQCVTPAQLGIVTFTHSGWTAEDHSSRVAAIAAQGYAAVTSTSLRGDPALRLCTINPRTTEADIIDTLRCLAAPTHC